MHTDIIIYSDGSSRGNPGPGGFGAITVYPNAAGEMRIDEWGGREDSTTNNRMELLGVITALEGLDGYYADGQKRHATILTDSGYVLNGINLWIHGWKKNNWITKTKEPVKNVDLWQRLDAAMQTAKGMQIEATWVQIPGHSGIAGNERCDVIATGFADDEEMDLFKGAASEYSDQAILIVPDAEEIRKRKASKKEKGSSKSSSSNKAAYSYVSYVDGALSVDKTWAECEKRVKGAKGARFKKSFSAEDEAAIIADFTS